MLGSRRDQGLLATIVLLVLLGLLDRLGLFGWQDDDHTRYHGRIFEVVHVVDGDTLDLGVPDGDRPTTRVRLWGVDTPEVEETGQPSMFFGPQASAYARELVLNRRVRIELSGERPRDRYGRLLAFVYLTGPPAEGQMLNELLVATGHAYADRRFKHEFQNRFSAAETRAQKAGAGLWAKVTFEQLPAWRQRLERARPHRSP